MPRQGDGSYSLPAGNPVVSGQTISSTVHNNTNTDIASALTASIAKDGQTSPTANLPMATFRHTNVGNPTARNQYATVDQVQDGDYNLVGSVSGTDTIAGSLAPSITAYVAGMQVVLIPANANTGAATLNLNGIGARDVQKYTSAGQVNVAANDLRAGIPALLLLDTGGDDWILLNPYSGALGDVTVGAITASGTITAGNLTTAGTVTSATISNSGTATSGVVAATTTLTVAGQSARDATNLFNTGTLPDARLSANVALYNGTMASFSSGALADARLSSNVVLLNGGQNFTGTAPTISSSRINTIANSGRIALADVPASGVAFNSQLNMTSVSRIGIGDYSVDYTAAGFTAIPVCIVTPELSGSAHATVRLSPAQTSTVVRIGMFDSNNAAADIRFSIVCHGV